MKKTSLALIAFLSVTSLEAKMAPHHPHRIIVRYHTLNEYIETHSRSVLDPEGRTRVVKLVWNEDVDTVLAQLALDPNVEYATPDYIMDLASVPNDPYYPAQWNLKNTGQLGNVNPPWDPATGTVGADVDAELAWDTTTGSKNVVIAIVDSGIDYTHQDLAPNIWANTGEVANNNIDDDKNGFVDDVRGWDFGDQDNDPKDDCGSTVVGHGTLVAGVAGAVGNNNVGISGMAWNATLMPMKAVDSGCILYMSNVAQSINYAVSAGANIINLSLGQPVADPTLEAAITQAYQRGVVVVAAALNLNVSTPYYPAAYPTVIAVAATDRNDVRATFSNFGSWVDLAAPGVAIPATMPNNSYGFFSGTSNASPLTAGTAALVLSKYPSLTPDEVRARLVGSCENIDVLNPGFEGKLGAGRLNAARALLAVTEALPARATRGNLISLTLGGVSFVPGLSVSLERNGAPALVATEVAVNDPTLLSCRVDLSAAVAGPYDVVVRIGQTVQRLRAGFTVEDAVAQATPASANVFPNPFRPGRGDSQVTFGNIARGSDLHVYEMDGRLIKALKDDNQDGQIEWDATNRSGERVASGVYLYRATDTGGNERKSRLVVIR